VNQLRLTVLAACLCVSSAVLAQVNGSTAFGRPLACGSAPSSATLLTTEARGFATSAADAAWVADWMKQVGYPAVVPPSGDLREAALSAAGLLQRGHVVAAKMAQDEAIATVPGYRASPFSRSFEALLTIVTQPVQHASYPESVRAEGETRGGEHGTHTHGVDLEQSAASLGQIIARAEVAKRAMGEHYRNPSIRSYLLAHAFGDDVALKAATAAVCTMKLGDGVKTKLDTAARFMAMPAAGTPAADPNK
jgi:hypothetical protein